MIHTTSVIWLLAAALVQLVTAATINFSPTKVFNYQGEMPIRDDRLMPADANNTSGKPSEADLAAAEEACWKLINEESVVTFSLQNKVLDEMEAELKNLKMDDNLRAAIRKSTERMRANMQEASEALSRDSPDEFFDALFEATEDIVNMSAFIRDPKLEEPVFVALIKSVSRLGRNNTALIQQFTEMCSLANRTMRPRRLVPQAL